VKALLWIYQGAVRLYEGATKAIVRLNYGAIEALLRVAVVK
jgi:hypothetical protein